MENLRHVQIMQQHIRDAEHIGELLFLDAVNRLAENLPVFGGFDFLLQLVQPACEKSSGTAGKIYLMVVFDTSPICTHSPETA